MAPIGKMADFPAMNCEGESTGPKRSGRSHIWQGAWKSPAAGGKNFWVSWEKCEKHLEQASFQSVTWKVLKYYPPLEKMCIILISTHFGQAHELSTSRCSVFVSGLEQHCSGPHPVGFGLLGL